MSTELNELHQPIGTLLPDWVPPPWPEAPVIEGRFARLEPLNAEQHAQALYAAIQLEETGASWTYLPYGPFTSFAEYRAWIEHWSQDSGTVFFAIINKTTNRPVGVASYLRIKPASGSIEVGHLHFSNALKQTPAATDAMYLMMNHAFALGYRRYEWKCHALNAASRAAALRLGFTFEGIFRQATIVKGRSRDTAWFSIIDSEWPALKSGFEQWLAADNFDSEGKQRRRLSEMINGH